MAEFDQEYFENYGGKGIAYSKVAEEYALDFNALDRHFPDGPPKSVLDLGCGTGEMLKIIRKRYNPTKMLGVDLSPWAVENRVDPAVELGDFLSGDVLEHINTKGPFDFILVNVPYLSLEDINKTLAWLTKFNPEAIVSFTAWIAGNVGHGANYRHLHDDFFKSPSDTIPGPAFPTQFWINLFERRFSVADKVDDTFILKKQNYSQVLGSGHAYRITHPSKSSETFHLDVDLSDSYRVKIIPPGSNPYEFGLRAGVWYELGRNPVNRCSTEQLSLPSVLQNIRNGSLGCYGKINLLPSTTYKYLYGFKAEFDEAKSCWNYKWSREDH